MELFAHDIYVLGMDAVDGIREEYYHRAGTDIINSRTAEYIAMLDNQINRLRRIKNYAIEYQKKADELKEDEPEW